MISLTISQLKLYTNIVLTIETKSKNDYSWYNGISAIQVLTFSLLLTIKVEKQSQLRIKEKKPQSKSFKHFLNLQLLLSNDIIYIIKIISN